MGSGFEPKCCGLGTFEQYVHQHHDDASKQIKINVKLMSIKWSNEEYLKMIIHNIRINNNIKIKKMMVRNT